MDDDPHCHNLFYMQSPFRVFVKEQNDDSGRHILV